MKHSIKTLMNLGACAASLLIPGVAYAASANTTPQSNWYFGASGDLTWLRNSNTGGGGNVDIGYQFTDFRLEGEVGYHGAGGDNGFGNTHYFTYMGNAYYDFNTVFSPSSSGWHVVPYIGAGLGDAEVHFGSGNLATTYHHHDNDFAYQGMAGLSFISASMPNTDWWLGYRYLGTDSDNIHANNLELGVRFHF